MDIKSLKKEFIFETRINLNDTEEYIVLREPTTLELREFGKDEEKNLDVLIRIFPECLVEHSFTDGDKPANNKVVAEQLKNSGTLFVDIIGVWMESLPFKKKKEQT